MRFYVGNLLLGSLSNHCSMTLYCLYCIKKEPLWLARCQEPDWFHTSAMPVKWPNQQPGAYISIERSFHELDPQPHR